MIAVVDNLERIMARVHAAEHRAGRRAGSVSILAVSKRQPPGAIAAAAAAGLTDFGENYVQEALTKIARFPDLRWHFVGAIQANKTRAIAARFAWVHTVDRIRIAQRLHEQRDASLPPLNVCIEVNVSGEATKAGVVPEAVADLAAAIQCLPSLCLRGLMTLPEPTPDYAVQYAAFMQLADLQRSLSAVGYPLDTLSMGTSSDFEAAIAAGATMIRLGTSLFGSRPA